MLRAQRLAAPVTAYVEQSSGHPFEADAAERRGIYSLGQACLGCAVPSYASRGAQLPVVRVGRGNTEGFVPLHDPCFIGGSNLTATKARLLLMACLMKFGSLPPAADPDHPTSAEAAAVGEKIALYQAVFDTH